MTARPPVHQEECFRESEIDSDSEYFEFTNTGGSPSPRKPATPKFVPEKRTPMKPPQEDYTAKSRVISYIAIFVGLVAITIAIACIVASHRSPTHKSCSFDKLRKQTPLQPEVWKALQVGIENMLNKKQITPNVYLFLYQDLSLQSLTTNIALETSRCFGNDSFIKMHREDFVTQKGDDYGYAIEQYKQKIKDGKVLVIINLNELSGNAARALHAICDTVNPIAPDVVIFLTLNPLKPPTPNTNSVQLAHDTLNELWGQELSSNELDPLIIRVTDQVLYLKAK